MVAQFQSTASQSKCVKTLFLAVDEKEDVGKPVIRLFGVNAQGNSVCAHVHNFTAYFYIHVVESNVNLTSEVIE